VPTEQNYMPDSKEIRPQTKELHLSMPGKGSSGMTGTDGGVARRHSRRNLNHQRVPRLQGLLDGDRGKIFLSQGTSTAKRAEKRDGGRVKFSSEIRMQIGQRSDSVCNGNRARRDSYLRNSRPGKGCSSLVDHG